MKKTKTPLRISLQFFASDLPVDGCGDADNGIATPQEEAAGDMSSVSLNGNDDQTEEEFEKLIKGGKFENAFKKRTQSIIDKRFKNFKALEKANAEQQPILDFLSAKYGIDSSSPALILERLQNERENGSEAEKEDNGVKVSAETRDMQTRQALVSSKAEALSKKWTKEGEELKKIFPSFDFSAELKNPAFASLLKEGLPLRKAYTAAHSDELLKKAVSGTAKRVAEQTLKSIRANGSRAAENGLHSGAGVVRKIDVASLSGDDIRSILKKVENGQKIRF